MDEQNKFVSKMMGSFALRAILLLSVVIARKLDYFSNFNDGSTPFSKKVREEGNVYIVTDYVTLKNDPIANLPASFTVCSSVFVKFMITANNFIEILKEDGGHWLQVDLLHLRDFSSLTERITLGYYNPASGKDEAVNLWNPAVPITPHTWYHMCLGLDSVTGLIRIVINGFEIVNEIKDFFRNTTSIKPTSVAGKFLGKYIFSRFQNS